MFLFHRWRERLKYDQAGGAGDGGGGSGGQGGGQGGGNGSGGGDPLFGNSGGSGGGGQNGGQGGEGGGNQNAGGNQHQPYTLPDKWQERLPDNLKKIGNLGNFTTLEDILTSYQSAQSMIGADKIVVPSKSTTPEQWKEIDRKLGVPEKLEDYKYDLADKDADTEFHDKFKELAHSLGIRPAQAKGMADWFNKLNKEATDSETAAINQRVQADMQGLQKEWGQAWDENILMAKAAMNEWMDPKTQEMIRASGLGKNANFLRFLQKAGSTLSEDKIHGGGGGGGKNGRLSPAEAAAEIKTIMDDPKSPYYDPESPQHLEVKNRVNLLFDLQHGIVPNRQPNFS